jgi:hypothetical protein
MIPFFTEDERGVGLQVLLVRDFATASLELDPVQGIERQPRELGQVPGQRGFAAPGIAEHRHLLHATRSVASIDADRHSTI